MAFESLSDYLVAAAYLTPLWIGAFATGWYAGQRHVWKEAQQSIDSIRSSERRTITAMRNQYGIEGPIILDVQRAETEH